MAEEIAFENGRISNFQGIVILTLDRVIQHTIVHQSSPSTYMPNFIEIKDFCGRTDRCTYICTNSVSNTQNLDRQMDKRTFETQVHLKIARFSHLVWPKNDLAYSYSPTGRENQPTKLQLWAVQQTSWIVVRKFIIDCSSSSWTPEPRRTSCRTYSSIRNRSSTMSFWLGRGPSETTYITLHMPALAQLWWNLLLQWKRTIKIVVICTWQYTSNSNM